MQPVNEVHATPRGLAAILFVALAFGPVIQAPAWAEQEAATDRAPQEEGQQPEDYTVQDEVFVEGAPPDIPTSNTVAAKLPLSLRETPASVSVVGATVLEEQDAFILGDALENVSGMNVHRGSGIFDFFVLRGLDSVSSGLIMTDGAPEPEATAYQLYNVDRVEVLKGPAAFLYGGGPLGATINLVRKQPQSFDFTRLSLSGGSFSTFEGSVDANLASASGKVGFRLNGLWQQSDGYRDGQDSETWAINPSLTFRPSDRTRVNVNLEVADIGYMGDAGIPLLLTNEVPDVPRTRSYQAPFDTSEQDVYRFQIDVETHLGDGIVLRNKTYYRQLDWFSKGTIYNGVFPNFTGGLDVSRTATILDDSQKFYGNQLEGLFQVSTGAITHNLLVGLELARRTDAFTFDIGLLPNIDLVNPVETATEPVFLIPGQGFGADTRADILAPYVVDQISFSERFQILVGLRWDNLDFADDANGTSRSDDEVSPMAGIVFSPTESLSLYANWGEAFAPPSTFVVGEERVPEESEQVELGIKKSFAGGRVETTLAFFRVDRKNIAIPDETGITRQTGDQRAEGIEFELAAEPAPGWRTSFAYAYTDAELTEFTESVLVSFFPPTFVTLDYAGNTPPFTPEHIANLWVTRHFESGFGLGLGARYVSQQTILENNAFEIDDYALLNASLFYNLRTWRLNLTLKNLTDENYYTRGFGNSVIPAPGFTAYAGASVGF